MRKEEARARVTLVDRLVDLHPGTDEEPVPFRTLSKDGLEDSIRRDLQWLLSTRSPLRAEEFEERYGTVLEFGVRDFTHLSPRSFDDLRLLANAVKRAVEAYEPRLDDVDVRVRAHPNQARSLLIIIDAKLVAGDFREPVSFPFVIAHG